MDRPSKQVQCPYENCVAKVTKGKYFKADVIQHFWGHHKMNVILAHKAAEYFVTTGKPLDKNAT